MCVSVCVCVCLYLFCCVLVCVVFFFFVSSIGISFLSVQFQPVASQFRAQLESLMTTLSATRPHFVKCMRPNEEKRPYKFLSPQVLEQMRAAGLVQALRVRRTGFPHRLSHSEFLLRFGCLALLLDARVRAAIFKKRKSNQCKPPTDAGGSEASSGGTGTYKLPIILIDVSFGGFRS